MNSKGGNKKKLKTKPHTFKQELFDIQQEIRKQMVEEEKKAKRDMPVRRTAKQSQKRIHSKNKEKPKHKSNVVMTDELIKQLTDNPYITVQDGSRRILTCSLCIPGPALLHPSDVQKHLESKVS